MAKLQPDYGNTFINPYNFISKTTQVTRDVPKKGNLTGSISCRLIVKTELALPDHSEGKDRRYPFFNINGAPVIPGSELRGCIRSVYEALTPSCFSVINCNILTKRILPDAAGKPGILRFTGDRWVVFEAEKEKNPPENAAGVYRKWNNFNAKKTGRRYNTSFYMQTGGAVHTCSNEEMQKFDELMDIYLSYAKPEYSCLFNEIKDKIKRHEDIVVFYKKTGGLLTYFSPAQISRSMFQNTVASLLGQHAAGICGKNEQYCPTCALFGTLGDGNALASRLRFGDAKADSVVISPDFRNLPELSSPKITSVEFYSNRSNVYCEAEQWDYDDEGVHLNGRKFYFHSTPKTDSYLGDRSIAVKTAEAGSTFRFEIHFNDISEEQLRQLLWIISIGENQADSRLCHKLGAGKPVGYGSVKMLVDNVSLRTFSSNGYMVAKKSFSDLQPDSSLFSEKKALDEFQRIADLAYTEGKKVAYPIADDRKGTQNSTAAHQWFSSNRLTANRTRTAQFRYVLHPISQNVEDLELPAMTFPSTYSEAERFNTSPRGSISSGQPQNTAEANMLQEGNRYNAKLGEPFSDRYGNSYYKLIIDGVGESNGKTYKVKQNYVKGKKIGDTINVTYNGLNDNGVPKFWINK